MQKLHGRWMTYLNEKNVLIFITTISSLFDVYFIYLILCFNIYFYLHPPHYPIEEENPIVVGAMEYLFYLPFVLILFNFAICYFLRKLVRFVFKLTSRYRGKA